MVVVGHHTIILEVGVVDLLWVITVRQLLQTDKHQNLKGLQPMAAVSCQLKAFFGKFSNPKGLLTVMVEYISDIKTLFIYLCHSLRLSCNPIYMNDHNKTHIKPH